MMRQMTNCPKFRAADLDDNGSNNAEAVRMSPETSSFTPRHGSEKAGRRQNHDSRERWCKPAGRDAAFNQSSYNQYTNQERRANDHGCRGNPHGFEHHELARS